LRAVSLCLDLQHLWSVILSHKMQCENICMVVYIKTRYGLSNKIYSIYKNYIE
jgi:hypothetical protein